mgnify:CR=1 FL=1
MYTIVINCHLAIFWKFNSVPDVSNVLKLPTPILLEVSLSTMGTVFVGFHLRLRQHIIYFHWSSPFQNYLSIFPFLILKFRIPTTCALIILFFLPLLSSTLPKSELRAAITTILQAITAKSHLPKTKKKVQQPRSRLPTRWIIVNNSHKFQNFRQLSNLFSQIWLKKRHTSLFSGIWHEIRKKIHQKFAEKMQNSKCLRLN